MKSTCKTPYCIGLTGTVASGKSSVIDYFRTRGIETFSADAIARQLTQKNTPALMEITKHFGSDILTAHGELDRKQLRRLMIQDPTSRQWLEQLLHPTIRECIKAAVESSHSPYCVVEIPLLTDRAHYPYVQRVLLITAQPEQQIARLIARDHCSKEEALALLKHQETNNPRAKLADDILINDGTLEELYHQLDQLHEQYKNNGR